MRVLKHDTSVLALLLAATIYFPAQAQEKPRLVVGITVDQMRWDYLLKFKHRWNANGGIRMMMERGYALHHTSVNYLPTFTACGHAAISTGSVPAIHGITGNQWFDQVDQSYHYCTGDTSVKTVGSQTDAGFMSPRNLLTTTVADELRLATAFRGKSIGIALKDRGGILTAGHTANAAYWYDDEVGKWVTSSYYMPQLPAWVLKFNTTAKVDSLYALDWHLLHKEETYTAFSLKNNLQSAEFTQRKFPQGLKRFAGTRYDVIAATPQGNTLTTEFAKACIINEQLGVDSFPDLLSVSYSSIDYIGHTYGPSSYEVEDALLKFDLELGAFFRFLDKQVGEGAWMAFLTSDHGVAEVPAFGKAMELPSGNVEEKLLGVQVNEVLKNQFGLEGLCKGIINQQVILNIDLIRRVKKLSINDVVEYLIPWLEGQHGILRVVRLDVGNSTLLPQVLQSQFSNSYYPRRSGHLQIMYKSGYVEGVSKGGTSHGTGYTYDTRIPLLWYGWKIPRGASYRNVNITDIAPTLSALLDIPEPSGSIGQAIPEIVNPVKVRL